MSEPEVSIVSVTYRNFPQTKEFVDSVIECTKSPFELVMVDNGSPKDVADYLDSLKDKIENYTLVRLPSNLGIGPGMNAGMRACKTNYLFRCDSDIVIQSAYWTQFMREIVDKYPEVGAVGTAITGGKLIRRDHYTETDICLSNCMLIPRRTIDAIDKKMKEEMPRISKKIAELIQAGVGRYDGYFKHLGSIINEMHYDNGYWAKAYPYGTDDFHYSMLIRWAGLHIAKEDRTMVFHKDESMRPDWTAERHRRVSEGFQYWRTFWEIFEDFYDIPSLTWDCWPMNKRYEKEYNNSIKIFPVA